MIKQPPRSTPLVRILSARFSPEGQTLAVFPLAQRNEVQFWNSKTGQLIALYDCPELFSQPPVMPFSPDGQRLVIAASIVQNTSTGVYLAQSVDELVHGYPPPPLQTKLTVVKVVDVKTERLQWEFSTPHTGISDAAFSPDVKTLAVAGGDWTGTVILSDVSALP